MNSICESASLASLQRPPSRANFKGSAELFWSGAETDSQESQSRKRHGSYLRIEAADRRENSRHWTQSLFRGGRFLGRAASEAQEVARWARGDRYAHPTGGRCVLDRVIEQVADHLPHAPAVPNPTWELRFIKRTRCNGPPNEPGRSRWRATCARRNYRPKSDDGSSHTGPRSDGERSRHPCLRAA